MIASGAMRSPGPRRPGSSAQPRSTVGRPINPRPDWAEFKDILKAAGIDDARPHDARHTAATLLLEQGVDISVVQEILGHATLAVTKRYTHVTKKLTRAAAKRMGKALWG